MSLSSVLALCAIMVAGNPCKETMMGDKHLVLTMDGGGIRGVYTARVIERIQEEIPEFMDRVDSMAGASTGGILCAGLADGLSGKEGVAIYRDRGAEIFKDNWRDNIFDMNVAGVPMRGAQYDTEPLAKVLRDVFGDKTLGHLGKKAVIPTLATDRRMRVNGSVVRMAAPKFLSNWPGSSDTVISIVNALRYCSAAPTFFPAVYGMLDGRPTYFVDGGVFDNNPSLTGAIEAHKEGVPWEDILVLSLGTGANPHYIAPEKEQGDDSDLDAGVLWWMSSGRLLSSIMEPAQFKSHLQCQWLIEEGQYHRVNSVLPQEWPLDSVKAVPEILEAADAVDIRPVVEWLKLWMA